MTLSLGEEEGGDSVEMKVVILPLETDQQERP